MEQPITRPLADRMRPDNIDDIAGQEHLLGTDGTIRRLLQTKNLSSMIFYGPPGTGKTTTAHVVAKGANMPIYKLNAVTAGLKDIKEIAEQNPNNTVLLYLDEIQYFNKKQQQSLLPFIESGNIILIASTTDNPWFCCYDALRSRCHIFKFTPLSVNDINKRLSAIYTQIKTQNTPDIHPDIIKYIAQLGAGDMRRAINILDLVLTTYSNATTVAEPDIEKLIPSTNQAGFDAHADVHYDLLGGLQKSIRGSDPDAALYYLARLLDGGDILSACRRLLVIASEDIGMARPDAPAIVYACTEAAKQLGLPEAAIPLGHAAVFLATAPKSNSTHIAYEAVLQDIHNGLGVHIPVHLQSPLFKGYKYPHDYPRNWVEQQYLPDDMVAKRYYVPGSNNVEQQINAYWNVIKNKT